LAPGVDRDPERLLVFGLLDPFTVGVAVEVELGRAVHGPAPDNEKLDVREEVTLVQSVGLADKLLMTAERLAVVVDGCEVAGTRTLGVVMKAILPRDVRGGARETRPQRVLESGCPLERT